jgi:hypothetical protein
MWSLADKIRSIKKINRKSLILNSLPFIIALIIYVLVRLSVKNPKIVESFYSAGFYPVIEVPLSWFSSLFSFSLGDIFYTIIVLAFIFGLVAVIFRKIKLGVYLLRTIQVAAILYSFFYLFWGYNYFRPGIESRLDWQKFRADEIYFRQVLDTVIVNVNRNFIVLKESEYSSVNDSVDKSYIRNSSSIGINYKGGAKHPKKMIYSSKMAKFGLSGYYGPYFSEVQLNSKLLPMEYPFALAHEVAHKCGVASEAEANFVSFVICNSSEDPRLKYSGNLMIMLYFLNDAQKLKDYGTIVKKIDSRAIADIQFMRKYYTSLQNETLEKVSSAANDAYLKANSIKTGIKNYNQVVALVISGYHNSSKK